MIEFANDYPESRAFIEAFLNPTESRPKFVFGTNHEAEEIANQIDLTGFVDDLKEDSFFHGLPVIRSQDIPQNSLVVIVALMRPNTLSKKMQSLGIEYLHSIALMRFSNLTLSQPWFWKGFDEDFCKHRLFYENFDKSLADDISISTFRNLMNFRLTGNLAFTKDFIDLQEQQYFEPFLELKAGESFADIGCYDGATSLEFIRRCPDYHDIEIFEPEQKNLDLIKRNLAQFENVTYHDRGLSDQQETSSIIASGSTSKVVEENVGDYTIKLDKLDNLIKTSITFLKMDIEGAEQKALDGAREFISTNVPKLAICVYHQGNDFRVIFNKVLSFYPDYKVYLRHYTEGIVETVMYFIPEN